MAGMADTFAKALQKTEETRDPDHLVRLFADSAELSNYTHSESGAEGARRFWSDYLDQFGEIRSRFSRLIESDGQAALVWSSEGKLKDGQPIAYSGVSVLELDGDKVRRFETYYDSAAFLRPDPSTASGG